MTRFLIRRLALAVLVVVGVVILTFAIARLVPGDPAASWAGPRASREEIAQVREDLGLNLPLPAQIWPPNSTGRRFQTGRLFWHLQVQP